MTAEFADPRRHGIHAAAGDAIPSVSVLIPTHDRAECLRRTLESLAGVAIPGGSDIELIACANACTDETEDVVLSARETAPFPVRLISEPCPGLNLARNASLRAARGGILAFLDDDVRVSEGWLRGLLAGFSETGADLLAGKVTLWWGNRQAPAWFSDRCERLVTRLDLGDTYVPITRPAQVVGANFAFRREVFESVGGFERSLGRTGTDLLSGGDSEFVGRALAAGFKAMFVPDMAVEHWVAPERATRQYMARAALGRGRTRAALELLSDDIGRWRLARHALAQVLAGAWRQIGGALRRDAAAATDGLIIRKRGEGTLVGLVSPRFRRTPHAGED